MLAQVAGEPELAPPQAAKSRNLGRIDSAAISLARRRALRPGPAIGLAERERQRD
jgi:hypothetical protein